MKFLFLTVVSFLGFLAITTGSPLWGTAGHQLTANVAQSFLNSGANSETNYLLANVSGQMSAIAVWADQVRNQKAWAFSAPFHYADAPDWACKFVNSDCPSDGCVVSAITNYTEQLIGGSKSSQEAAIRFVVHFHGDIHQPLHCGFLSNKGGNSLTGTYFGSPNNLHSIWDTSLITTRLQNDFNNDQDKYVDYLVSQINGPWKDLSADWIKCPEGQTYPCPDAWANESANLACKYAYTDQNGKKIANGFSLSQAYYDNVKDIIDQQLAKGGYRLATTLNQVWNKKSPGQFRLAGRLAAQLAAVGFPKERIAQ